MSDRVTAPDLSGLRALSEAATHLRDLETFISGEADNGRVERRIANAVINKAESAARLLDAARTPSQPDLRAALRAVLPIAERALRKPNGDPYFPEPNGAFYQADKRAIERALAALSTVREPEEQP